MHLGMQRFDAAIEHFRKAGVVGDFGHRQARIRQQARRAAGGQQLDAQRMQRLGEFDVVISCTASTLPIIGLGAVERALKARKRRPIFMVDLAVPRDIEPEVGRLDDVFLYTVDDLGKMVATGLERRHGAVDAAEVIIGAEVTLFMRWLEGRGQVPAIRDLHTRGEALRQFELERARRRLAKGDDPLAVIEALSQGITNKFLHGPTRLLQDAPDDVRAHLLEYLPRLFGADREK